MNPQPFPRRNQSILLVSFLLLLLTLSGSFVLTEPASTTSLRPQGAPNKVNQSVSPSDREMGVGVPKHIPLKIKVRNIKNEKWAHDLEIEVTNKSDKPIYYLSFLVIPQDENEERIAFWLHYGRVQLNNFSTPLESTDTALLPDDTVVLKIDESSADGWEYSRKKNSKAQPRKVGLVFQALNFGDGTGYMDTQGTPVEKNKEKNSPVASNQNCLSPPNQDQRMSSFLPAVFLPVNFFANQALGSLLNAVLLNPTSCCEDECGKWQVNTYTCQRVCSNREAFPFYTQLPCDSSQECRKVVQYYDYCLYEGIQLTNAQDGVQFDLAGSGQRYQIAWTAPNTDDAWLALDRNGDGQVNSGKELFGNVTEQPKSAEPQGFSALAVFDATRTGGNEDGRIDNRDTIFGSLRLWQDVNHNGISEPNELHTLPSLDVAAIDLDYKDSRRTDEFGNRFRYRAKVYDQRRAHVSRWAWDVFLKLGP